MSVIKQIFDCLEKTGEKVYFPGYHEGECTERYIVVKAEGSSKVLNISSERPLYDIMLYVPKNRYTELETMARIVKEALKELYPMVEYTGSESPSFYDDTVKGHMVSLPYQGIRKIKKMKGV